MCKFLAFSQCRVEFCVAELDATFDTGRGDSALDRRELERERPHRFGQSGENLGLEALDIDLDKGWSTVLEHQKVERGLFDSRRFRPALFCPARSFARGTDKIGRSCGN